MKKKLLSLALALAMCLSLSVPAFAAEDETGATTIKDDGGYGYSLSKPVLGTYTMAEGWHYDEKTGADAVNVKIYKIPEGTVITPLCPEGTRVEDPELDAVYYNLPYEVGLKQAGAEAEADIDLSLGKYVSDFSARYVEMGYFEGMGMDSIGELEGTDPNGDPIQPMSAGRHLIAREVSWNIGYNTPGGSSVGVVKTGYLYVEVVPENGSASSEPSTPAAPAFTDVAESSPFYNAILWAVDQKITNGTSETTFSPGSTCTRAQILTFLWRAAGSPEPAGLESPYSDVVSGSINADFYKAILWAVEKGIADKGGTFGPNEPCTRAGTVVYLWKYAGSPEVKTEKAFTDVADGADYAGAVAWAVDSGVTSGTSDTTFSPENTCTRGQIVTFLCRAFAE